MTSKEREAIKVREAVEGFLAGGGIITQIPYGPDLHPRNSQTRYHFADPALLTSAALQSHGGSGVRISQAKTKTIRDENEITISRMMKKENMSYKMMIAKRHEKLTTL